MFVNPDDDEMRTRLEAVRTIAVVGLSDKPVRDSFGVAKYLEEKGYTVVPVNPTLSMWETHQAFPSLRAAKEASERIGKPIDLVVVFRRASEVEAVAKEVVGLGLKAAWFQLGVIDWEAGDWARRHGVWVVMDHCVAVEHRRLVGHSVVR